MILLPLVTKSPHFLRTAQASSLRELKAGRSDTGFTAMLGWLCRHEHMLAGCTSDLFVDFQPEPPPRFSNDVVLGSLATQYWHAGFKAAAAYCLSLEETLGSKYSLQIVHTEIFDCLNHANGPEQTISPVRQNAAADFIAQALIHGWKYGASVRKWVAENINPDWPVLTEKEPIMPKLVSEHLEQARYFAWVKKHRRTYEQLHLVFAIPNGGYRHKAVAARMRAEGVEPGIPDIFVSVPKNGLCGLYIEMKSTDPKATLSNAQRGKIRLLRQNGYHVCVCKGADHAIAVTKEYLGI
jgi:hypothetical protein